MDALSNEAALARTDTPGIRPTWIEIDLGAIAHNVRALRSVIAPGVKIFASLKRNANGCGLVPVAQVMQDEAADGIALGNIDDALLVRRAAVTLPILLYPTCLPGDAPVLVELGLMPTLSTAEEVSAWEDACPAPLDVFLKIDIGGLRAGAMPRDAVAVARRIVASGRLRLAGVYSHVLAPYTGTGEDLSRQQLVRFRECIGMLEQDGITVPIRMVASSSIVVGHPDMDFNAIDPGRLLMGLSFPTVAGRDLAARPALAGLKSRIVMRKPVVADPAEPIASLFKVRPGMVIGLVPFGWGDGYPRATLETTEVLVCGRRVRVLPPAHSELLRIDLTDVPEAGLGEEVVFLGQSGEARINLPELAAFWRTDNAGVYGALRDHVRKVYLSY